MNATGSWWQVGSPMSMAPLQSRTASRRQILIVGAAAAVGGLVGAACELGGTRRAVPAQAPVRKSAVTIEVRALVEAPPDAPAYRNLFARLQQEAPHVTVSLLTGNLTSLQTAMAGGTPPDIGSAVIADLGTIYGRKLAVPAAQALKGARGWQPNGFLAGLRASHTFKGEMVTVPMVTSPLPLMINLELFDRAGLKPPPKDWTWSQLTDYAVKLTLRSGSETTQWGYGAPHQADFAASNDFNAMLHSFGGTWVDAAGERAAFHKPEGIAALEWLVDVTRNRRVSPVPWPESWRPAGQGQPGGRTAGFLLANNGGNAICPYELESLQQLERLITFRWQTVLQPKQKQQRAHQSAFSWFIVRGARQMEGATEFLRVAALPEVIGRWTLDQSRLPTHEAAVARPEWQAHFKEKPVIQVHWEAAKGGTTYPGIPGWTDVRPLIATAVAQAIKGEVSPRSALEDAARQADPIFEKGRSG